MATLHTTSRYGRFIVSALAAVVAACDGSDGKSGSERDASSYPEGCEVLAEVTDTLRCRAPDAQCEQAKASAQVYDFGLTLRESRKDDNGDDVAYSESELGRRRQCVVTWLQTEGFEVFAPDSSLVVRSDWGTLEPYLTREVFDGYSPSCLDEACTHCAQLDEDACDEDAFCWPAYGRPVDAARTCLLAEEFAGCVTGGTSDAETFARDERGGDCWWFPVMADLPGFDDGECGEYQDIEDIETCDG